MSTEKMDSNERGTGLHTIGELGMEVLEYHKELADLWEDLVRHARNGHFMATRRFLDYHGDRFQDRSLLFMRRGRPVAAIAINQEGEEWISHRGLPYGGLIAAPELSTEQTWAIFLEISNRMSSANITGLRYTPLPEVYQRHPFEDDIFVLHLLGARLSDAKLAARARLPDLTLMHKRSRMYLRQAEKSIRVESDVPLGEFWSRLTEYQKQRRQAEPLHSEAQMQDLMSRFPDEIKLLAIRDASGAIVSGSVVFLTDRVIRIQYFFGAADPGAPRAAALALDQYAIKTFGGGRAWIDFGTSMNPGDGLLDLQLHSTKERSGCRGMLVKQWFWNGNNSGLFCSA